MKIQKQPTQGINLIELLTVIFVVVILVGIAFPGCPRVQIRESQTKGLMNAKQIGLACKLFAEDHDGHYPSNLLNSKGEVTTTPPSSSNAALAQLIPEYIPDEKIFWVPQDKAYCNASEPDGKPPWLGAGENHWGYVINLTIKSDPQFPLIADGTVPGGTYSTTESSLGGTWKARKAIMIRVDGSGSIENINKTTLTIPGPTPDISNILQPGQKDWLGANNRFLNPIPKSP